MAVNHGGCPSFRHQKNKGSSLEFITESLRRRNSFEYYFSDGLSDAMKGNFQNVFKDAAKAKELWDANPSFFMRLSNDITKVDDVIDMAIDGDLVNLINWVK